MNYTETMAELKKTGTAQNIKIYKRHGAVGNMFGVSFANLGKLKKKIKVDTSDAEKAVIPVFYGGQQIGEVIHMKAKEIGGLDHLEFWVQLTFGAGIEKQLKDVIMAQGIYFGKPPE